MKILVTGSQGFIGKNLIATFNSIINGTNKTTPLKPDIFIYDYDIDNTLVDLKKMTSDCDFVIHLAGVNRPVNHQEFYENSDFTQILCDCLIENKNSCPVLIASSIQVSRDNDYGKSKMMSEESLKLLRKINNNSIYIYRFSNTFGKWCKPNYNSVVATWCYNIANDIEIKVDNPNAEITLCYIDDVVEEMINCICGKPYIISDEIFDVEKKYKVTLETLKTLIYSFKNSRTSLIVPNQKDELTKKLYATYLSYLAKNDFSYSLLMHEDERGSFTEFIKTQQSGQFSVNISKSGIVKGNHWHHTKNEKFMVVSGTGIIRFRKIDEKAIIEYKVSGKKLEVIDIPTGYTHNIENIGLDDMVTIMWANEIFDPEKPDTYYEDV